MRLRAIVAIAALAVVAAACTTNPVGVQAPPEAPAKDGGGWMGSGH